MQFGKRLLKTPLMSMFFRWLLKKKNTELIKLSNEFSVPIVY